MKTLDTKEWIAVVIAIFVVGFFFVFGQTLINLLSGDNNNQAAETQMVNTPRVSIQEVEFGAGEIAQNGKSVVVHYTGRLTDGTAFDSSLSRGEPIQVVLGSGQLIKGFEEGLQGMRAGGKRIITIPSELGYGMNDYGPIPGGSTLIFEVELLRVE